MIEIQFKFWLDKKVEDELLLTKNLKLLADVEGRFEILINNQTFFEDDYFLLLEFGIELKKWLIKVSFDGRQEG